MEDRLAPVLARLYAPGLGPGYGAAPPARWPAVVRALRRSNLPPPEALSAAGLSLEALLSAEFYGVPNDLLTAADPRLAALWPLAGRVARGLPASAVEVSLDAPALPPAIWFAGDLPEVRQPTLAGIGCRRPSEAARAFARAVGHAADRNGIALVSGGAEGCDAAFADGHRDDVAILPHGLDLPHDLRCARVSPFPRDALFSRERAMRRNALVVASADLTLVASARLKEGGTWHAALGALRRRAPLAVYIGPGAGSGAPALAALGALPVRDPEEALAALALVREIGPNDDPTARWADLTGRPDPRAQPALIAA